MNMQLNALSAILILFVKIMHCHTNHFCPDLCNQQGTCGDYGICHCNHGWEGPSCSLAVCPEGIAWSDGVIATDNAHNYAVCSNRGRCDRTTGICACDSGFEGQACDRLQCNCNGHGQCLSMRDYAQTKDPGLGDVFTYENNWDSDKIFGCKCDEGYSGYNCLERLCPTGDDPKTGQGTNEDPVQLNEKQYFQCVATGGSFTITFRGETTEAINIDDTQTDVETKLEKLSTIRNVAVSFAGTVCTSVATTTVDIEFLSEYGDLPNIILDSTLLTHDSTSTSLQITNTVTGTKENGSCSNRGKCETSTGICECYTGFGSSGDRGDCGSEESVVSSCPGEISCSGHGVCQGSELGYYCACNSGWTGGDCNEQLCLSGTSWFDLPSDNDDAHKLAECSDAGSCDRSTGECSCKSGFTGTSCNRMDCPNDCSGHGTCYTMEALAELMTDNGDAASWTYGQFNALNTWDKSMIQGCYCNTGYSGHDCSLRLCPTGDDPETEGVHEIQTIECVTTGTESMVLTFRQQSTSALIGATLSESSLESALESLSTIDDVDVTFSSGSNACVSGNVISIKFLSNFGSLPPLTATLSSGTITIKADGTGSSQKGTKENAICSNRGLCEETTGICRCFDGYTSSDGNGQSGNRGDCGYKEINYFGSAAQLNNLGS